MSRLLPRLIAVVGLGAALGGAFGCAGDGDITEPVAQAAARISASPPQALSVDAERKVEVARTASARVGKLHHDAMQDLLANLPRGPKSRSQAARCQAAAELTLRHAPMIAAAYGVQWTDSERRRLVRDTFQSIGPCKSQGPMSIFADLDGSVAYTAILSMDDPPGTEAVVGPINDLIAAVKNSDGTVASVEAITISSLRNNSSLGTVDLEILAGVAALANSSAEEWNTHSANGGFGDEYWEGEWDWTGGGGIGAPSGCTTWPGDCQEYDQSIFNAFSFWRKAAFVVGSDLIGCGGAAAQVWYTGAAGAGVACGIAGVATSAVSLLGVMLM